MKKEIDQMLVKAGAYFGGEGVVYADFDPKKFATLIRADERNSWPAEMEAMEQQVNILTDALAEAKADEREACADLCDRFANRMMSAEECADAIRARGSNTCPRTP